jgi:tRNA pseudouridine55 synthase
MKQTNNISRLFVANKPSFVGSNKFLSQLKRKYKVKKAGFSGTLDPFAKGTLIVAFGNHTKLFQFLKKTPKVYKATLWLGTKSDTLDIESKLDFLDLEPISYKKIETVISEFPQKITYLPPKYSAKRVNGQRAYDLARNNEDFELKTISSEIFELKILNYNFPFLSFEISVSEGSYIRSIGLLIAQKLGTFGILSSLERVSEGVFRVDKNTPEKNLYSNIFDFLDLTENFYLGDSSDVFLGKKLKIEYFTNKKDGIYFVKFERFFSIIEINDSEVKYKLNRIEI